ncbi:hypothetical protein [Kribbella sp. NPDC003557]|uniref:hypothetical protein n=1 Tax=Kribbella sp. NPDC003557 TaxID=3154449 RepID=UPI0033B63B96
MLLAWNVHRLLTVRHPTGYLPLRALAMIPLTYLLLDVPAVLLGAGVVLLALVAIALRARLTDERIVLYVVTSALLTPSRSGCCWGGC